MSSEVDNLQTNEFLRRRKLRLQQVREQSKSIAKKVRQRTSEEKLRQLANVNSQNDQDYLKVQDKFVKELREYCTQSVKHVGEGHKQASTVKDQGSEHKTDLSKSRGKAAVVELRKKKQEKLDEQKKKLDRKLQARDVANEISREKSLTVINRLSSKSSTVKPSSDENTETCEGDAKVKDNNDNDIGLNLQAVTQSDMGTQWDEGEELLHDWDPNVPTLPLAPDEIPKDSNKDDTLTKRKKLNLFTLSDDMPSSLRGGHQNTSNTFEKVKPSLTLVTEYLQARALKLRQYEPAESSKKPVENLNDIRQTIMRTRTTRTEGVCVFDDQILPAPCWHAEQTCPYCKHNKSDIHTINTGFSYERLDLRYKNSASNATKIPTIRSYARNMISGKQSKISEQNLNKKPSVTMYNHATRDSRDIPYEDTECVRRDQHAGEDAFTQAIRHNVTEQPPKSPERKTIHSRNKVAMSKLHVEKEFKDTMNFLNAVHKDKSQNPVIKNAYKDDEQQQEAINNHQRKMEHEFKKIEREHKHTCKRSNRNSKSKSLSLARKVVEDESDEAFKYSWMPVPESDDNLAIHTIPTTLKEPKSGNSVRFNKVDGYHEYRSRHKHTPPTKELGSARNSNRKVIEAVFVEDIESSANNDTDTGSTGNLSPEREREISSKNENMSDAERIIIYKVIESKNTRKKAKPDIMHNESTKSVRNEKDGSASKDLYQQNLIQTTESRDHAGNMVSLQHLKEGIYKAVTEEGTPYNLMNYCKVDTEIWSSKGPLPWWTNVPLTGPNPDVEGNENKLKEQLGTDRDHKKGQHQCTSASLQWEVGNQPVHERKPTECKCGQLSSSTSATSFKTADKVNNIKTAGEHPEYIKMIDGDGQEAGKFYIGASGFLRDDAYEVIFQLRKKDKTKSPEDIEKPIEAINKSHLKPDEVKLSPVVETIHEKNKSSDEETLTDKKSYVIEKENRDKIVESINIESVVQSALESPKGLLNTEIRSTQGQSHSEIKTRVDKGVNKSVQVEPDARQNSENTVKSMFTQTSFSSPQTFIQMSSSASTSYMSPPERIMPKFLAERSKKSDYCKRHEDCRCRKCTHKVKRKLTTPPNTVRSDFDKSGYTESECEKEKKKHRCRKVDSRDGKTKRKLTTPHTPSNQAVWDNLILRLTSETSSSINTDKRKPNINPLIKTYIDHLLSLNRDSLKAIEVVNLECSSVSTPGSSVIDVTHNVGFTQPKKNVERKISLEQIKKYIEHQLIQKLKEREKESDTNKPKAEIHRKSNISTIPTLPKRKPVHKVKSLNISKNVLNSAPKMHNSHKSIKRCSVSNPKTKCSAEKNGLPHEHNFNRSHEPMKFSEPKKPLKKRNALAFKGNKSVETMVSTIPICSDVNIPTFNMVQVKERPHVPVHSSTQTNLPVENDVNYIKIAESKLQNMEKIATLTEKCTTRLSNLAKVLEEVRKNKCTSYGHVSSSDGASSSDHNLDNHASFDRISTLSIDPGYTDNSENARAKETSSNDSDLDPLIENSNPMPHINTCDSNQYYGKWRTKPPPALSNYGKYYVTPHELSTVVEVDSPMSLVVKSQSPHSSAEDTSIGANVNNGKNQNCGANDPSSELIDPDLLQNNFKDETKVSMLDLNQFNKIMLQPFVSIQEYVKDVNVVSVDEASNIEDFTIPKEGINIGATDDVSSLHSDGSLPDVVSELLKRNIIAEPFKFDSGSNGNSTTVSSDSTLSFLKTNSIRGQRKSYMVQNKENVADSSDTVSMSSNPDLENAFKKLGMGWASSTLKKTKERLALSSSSNTSTSSLSQFKIKSFNQDIPALVTDSISSVGNMSKKKNSDKCKNAEQQTVITNSMTVKEFLTTELSKKITFTRKPDRSGQPDEFVSLYETKIPEELKESSLARDRDRSMDHSQNGNNRARTSTPVQIFKSMTYQSSSNSNTSNGLFSNADDLSSVKGSNSIRNHSTSDKDDLTIPNYSLKMRKSPDCNKSE